ncbi:MAG: hypothetical protein A2528_03350 [Candidatus Staskawiczbacteria bacterium RIFOXYD2_FULL_37_9]|uniref:Uncharacterized protein n=1 Tax=Candidatus Staskawiczbacteria bacterium RIFOXYB1_FULL_37_44 TaxID=1802223 RepID=A0A1G2IWD3_9BACT|nr:MAG: hypothetical protein A2358_02830 [Candidatus Staskawiczbacteria bacterium RIFOXYB1_FULL_37_44]OGZ83859.1 MAG: hypothetical protein A2416_02545 [Candidatus Staskawiczbacteria bacterium RIFOXYC1_FULL_37_52]OGZ89366.1 MAG: hypothetical protein A2581_00605 [Candidatus Staskawiczbacteria bacterium RIFOXYD1_FULL_37_110]OGZ94506.1 MAG: hypothetical protein A2528_03350 [Candidatus Staskawiczbacteria bacterium RIFOXYD2_FULL_37_9]
MKLFPASNLVLLHTSFEVKLAYLFCHNPEAKKNITTILKRLEEFSKNLNLADGTLEGVKRFKEAQGLEISRTFPKPYFDSGFHKADDLFFYLKEQDVNGYWVVGIDLFFPHLLSEQSLAEELRSCSFMGGYPSSNDLRFCEIYNITYN